MRSSRLGGVHHKGYGKGGRKSTLPDADRIYGYNRSSPSSGDDSSGTSSKVAPLTCDKCSISQQYTKVCAEAGRNLLRAEKAEAKLEKMKDLICDAAPLAWVGSTKFYDHAVEWDRKAKAIIGEGKK